MHSWYKKQFYKSLSCYECHPIGQPIFYFLFCDGDFGICDFLSHGWTNATILEFTKSH